MESQLRHLRHDRSDGPVRPPLLTREGQSARERLDQAIGATLAAFLVGALSSPAA